jgi:hypothetical protein
MFCIEPQAQVVVKSQIRTRMSNFTKDDEAASSPKSKKRKQRLPLCRDLKWPMVTSSNPIPCISDATFREKQAKHENTVGAR